MEPPRTPEKKKNHAAATPLTPNTKTLVQKTLENDAMRKKVTGVVNERIAKAKENLNAKVKQSLARYNEEVNSLRDELLSTIGNKIKEPQETKHCFFAQKVF
jgi:hypothetical protein